MIALGHEIMVNNRLILNTGSCRPSRKGTQIFDFGRLAAYKAAPSTSNP